MKARVKDTGEIVDVRYNYIDSVWMVKGAKYPIRYHERELDFIEDKGIDWDYWRRMYAGMAMQVVIYNDGHLTTPYKIARSALEYADALIKELRKEKKVKKEATPKNHP